MVGWETLINLETYRDKTQLLKEMRKTNPKTKHGI